MAIGRMCNRVTVTIQRQASAENAAQLMRSQHVGDVVVVDPADTRRPIGILTDRDIAIKVVAAGLAPARTTVGSVMSAPVFTVREDEGLVPALDKMARRGVRRAPAVDRTGHLVGLVSVDDLVPLLARELGRIGSLIQRDQVAEVQSAGDSLYDDPATRVE
jgi:CBS domain-containing protein